MKRLVRIYCLITMLVICPLAQQAPTIRAQQKQTAGLKVRSEMLVSVVKRFWANGNAVGQTAELAPAESKAE